MTQDTRKDRRVKIVSLNVRYKSATVDEFIENHAHDVSRGGIYIKTANPFPPGTLLKFEIRLASDQAVIAGVGRVVWKRDAGASSGTRPAGMGVKFIKIDDPSKAVIDRLINMRADAGTSFESVDGTEMGDAPSSPPPAARPTPPPKRASGSPPPATRAASPYPGAPAEKGAEAPPLSSQRPALTRKATMIGLGSSSVPPAAGLRPGGSYQPPRPATQGAPSAPPRPAAKMAMFPNSDPDWEAPPKEEQTVMRQAAELLEEALREAGGSMEEVGTNPLFAGPSGTSGTSPRSSSSVKATPPPSVARAVARTTPDAARSTDDGGATPKVQEGVSAGRRAQRDASGAAMDTPSKLGSAAAASKPRATAAVPNAAQSASSTQKSLARRVAIGVLAAAAVVAVIFVLREPLFGQGAAPGSVPSAAGTPTVSAQPSPTTASGGAAAPERFVPSDEAPTVSGVSPGGGSSASALSSRGDGSAAPSASVALPAPRAAARPAWSRPSPTPFGVSAPPTDKPATDKPATDKPSTDKPATDKPATDKPATDKPGTDKPATDKPSTDKRATDKPAASDSTSTTAPSPPRAEPIPPAAPAAKPKPTKPPDDNPY